jgi:hypothetical protein
MLSLSILYRGPLASCNYGCAYCSLAKDSTAASHAGDEASLARFVAWAAGRGDDRIAVFFTPAGEVLTHGRYQRAIARLTELPGIVKVAVQTNLSCSLEWMRSCHTEKLALWCTYHPRHVQRESFLEQCRTLDALGVRYSVGMVGLREHLGEAEQIRGILPPRVYLWINAYRHVARYYSPELAERFTAIDPLFPFNLCPHASHNEACHTGHKVIAVDGDGTIRRCHFVAESLGNLYQSGWDQALRPRPCPRAECHCHIGYVHLAHLQLDEIFQEGLLERIPTYVSTMGR